MKRKPDLRSNPALVWGLLLNALFLPLRYERPALLPPFPGDLIHGAALGLLLVGLILADPRRAARIRAWKAGHLNLRRKQTRSRSTIQRRNPL